ncbi:hypothetical protein [Caballeronia sp. AZ10_KS36]|uniref:hypothetical protein n=1 Tax=Caballeronia sp. AZ10_KS36 TaxID=2921757 RepID=UPI0020297842|nr:hypothetical protein [Caballeronia sp. AZ10_KS36]
MDLRASLDRPEPAGPVPDAYLGVWRRTLLRNAAGDEDRATRVYWLQSARVHVDLRVPANRRGFDGVTGVDALSRDALVELARQQGFAGFTQVDVGMPDICTWHRRIDFSPPSDARDIGDMRFERQEVLLEDGVDADYHERWEREPASVGASWGALVSRAELLSLCDGTPRSEPQLVDEGPAGFVARAGDFFMLARGRSAEASALLARHRGRKLSSVVADPAVSLDQARELVDFEISLGRIAPPSDAGPTIVLSTHPWREGCTVPLRFDLSTESAALTDPKER